MKKTILIAGILATSLIANSSQASQAPDNKKFYIGGGFQTNNVDYKTTSDLAYYDTIDINGKPITVDGLHLNPDDYLNNNFNNVNIFAGFQINKDLALEIGYFQKKSNYTNTAIRNQNFYGENSIKSKTHLKILNLDSIIKAGSYENIDFNFILGGSLISMESRYSGDLGFSEAKSKTQIGLNGGFGLEYKIDERFSIRTNFKYTMIDGSTPMNTIFTSNVGLKIKI